MGYRLAGIVHRTRKQVTYMQINQRLMFQVLHREGGFTLLEVLVAIALPI